MAKEGKAAPGEQATHGKGGETRVSRALALLAEAAQERLRHHPQGHLVAGSRETLDLALPLPVSGDAVELTKAVAEIEAALARGVEGLVHHRAAFRPGRVYCLRCATADCEHAPVPSPRATFAGYGPSGIPRFVDFPQWLVERRDPRAGDLYEGPSGRTLAVTVPGAELTSEVLAIYQDREADYRLHGQVTAGWYRASDERGHEVPLAVTFQVVSSRPPGSRRRLGLNVLVRGPEGESAEHLYDRMGEIPWAADARWAQSVLASIEHSLDRATRKLRQAVKAGRRAAKVEAPAAPVASEAGAGEIAAPEVPEAVTVEGARGAALEAAAADEVAAVEVAEPVDGAGSEVDAATEAGPVEAGPVEAGPVEAGAAVPVAASETTETTADEAAAVEATVDEAAYASAVEATAVAESAAPPAPEAAASESRDTAAPEGSTAVAPAPSPAAPAPDDPVAQAEKELGHVEARIEGLLKGLARRLEKGVRARGRRTRHAEERHGQGDRPTGMALADLAQARDENVFVDTRDRTFVVLGDRGRAHVFNRQGKLVTSVRYSPEAIERRQGQGRWKPLPKDEVAALRVMVDQEGG